MPAAARFCRRHNRYLPRNLRWKDLQKSKQSEKRNCRFPGIINSISLLDPYSLPTIPYSLFTNDYFAPAPLSPPSAVPCHACLVYPVKCFCYFTGATRCNAKINRCTLFYHKSQATSPRCDWAGFRSFAQIPGHKRKIQNFTLHTGHSWYNIAQIMETTIKLITS